MKGGEACCLAAICLPLGFAAGRTLNVAIVTMQREQEQSYVQEKDDGHAHEVRRLDDNFVICTLWFVVPESRGMVIQISMVAPRMAAHADCW